ncbi:tRNA (cytidine(34)-2'-O)-methyltransferase [hydrothermal vent metagenome]|uniref:tRNA (Cytidine(34)-2'-O)-methyltransferase n=1 Tax=hydrothermal vent metagenome TaxID=652676 RepID=A0A3B1B2G8_9ZZZZ
MFHIILFEPEIPPNTGNIIRLCANSGSTLHLVHPLGFALDDKRLRRAGLDYREWVGVQEHDNLEACKLAIQPGRIFSCTTRATQHFSDVTYKPGDALLFGPETRGLPQSLLDESPPEQLIRIPMLPESRSMNLSNAVSVILYEAWRQQGFVGGI